MKRISDPSKFRENVKNKLSSILNSSKNGDNLERGIYNCTLQLATDKHIVKKWDNIYFVQLYIDKFRTLYFNLQTSQIREQIINKMIKPQDLAFMTHQEMLPDKWEKIIKDIKIKNQNKYTPKIEASTDNFECYKCHAIETKRASEEKRQVKREEYTQCSYYQLQTRSADEPMTTYVTCIKCGTRWKC